jgi:hypothetical protein
MVIVSAVRENMHMSIDTLREVLVNVLSKVSPGENEVKRRTEATVIVRAVLLSKYLVSSKSFMTVIKEFYDSYVELLYMHWIYELYYLEIRTMGTFFAEQHACNPYVRLRHDHNHVYGLLTSLSGNRIYPTGEELDVLNTILGLRWVMA